MLKKCLNEQYPDCIVDDSGKLCNDLTDYEPLLESFGYEIIAKADEDDYQGDSIVLYKDNDTDNYGILIFGWGSCSGCDALQACKDVDDIVDLAKRLYTSIMWIGDASNTLIHIMHKDWDGTHLNKDMVTNFIERATKVLKRETLE
jgi:hypothetical protein